MGELVCLVYLEHLRDVAILEKPIWGDRSNEIVAFGKIGCTCRKFKVFLDDPVVRQLMDFELETFMVDLHPSSRR